MILPLSFILLLQFLLSMLLFKRDILSPAVVLSAVFLAATVFLYPMKEYWNITLKPDAIIAITVGNFFFIVTSVICHILFKRNEAKKILPPILISDKFISFVIICYLCIIFIYLYFLRKFANAYGFSGNIFSMVGFSKRTADSLKTDTNTPSVVSFLYNIGINLTFFWIYIFVRNVKKIKISKRFIMLVIISFFMGFFVSGSRGHSVLLAAYALFLYIIQCRKENTYKLSSKFYLRIFLAIILVILIFQLSASVIGRDSGKFEFLEYLAIYISAPIMNFSNTLSVDKSSIELFGSETFNTLHTSLSTILGYECPETTRVFWVANGHDVGNVATMYYDFYHDFGLLGCFLLPVLIAFIMQFLYEKVKAEKEVWISFYSMTYCWLLFLLFRSFFSNSFIDKVISFSCIKQLIIWAFAVYLLKRIKIGNIRLFCTTNKRSRH